MLRACQENPHRESGNERRLLLIEAGMLPSPKSLPISWEQAREAKAFLVPAVQVQVFICGKVFCRLLLTSD